MDLTLLACVVGALIVVGVVVLLARKSPHW